MFSNKRYIWTLIQTDKDKNFKMFYLVYDNGILALEVKQVQFYFGLLKSLTWLDALAKWRASPSNNVKFSIIIKIKFIQFVINFNRDYVIRYCEHILSFESTPYFRNEGEFLEDYSWVCVTTLRKHAYSNTMKISPPKTENFHIKKNSVRPF